MTLNKFQIRTDVLNQLTELDKFEDISKENIDKTIDIFKSYGKGIDYTCEILVKELKTTNSKMSDAIAFLLIELGNLEKLKDKLWEILKDTSINDIKKEFVCVILRGLGDNTNPKEYFNYVENAQEIIDNETKKLLETAIINPEAQIDFLDFLFSLPKVEQHNLLDSLQEDFEEKYMLNIVIPALFKSKVFELQEKILNILGNTKSPYAINPIIQILNNSQNDKLKKVAKKNLNMLKIAGVVIEEPIERGSEICKLTTPYQCYSNYIDGTGSQGLIISRKKENNDLIMFSVVINDTDGIIDSFGFYGLTSLDFEKIIERFENRDARIKVSGEYCKKKLIEAESINIKNNTPIPYEYSAWKSLLYDFGNLENHREETTEIASNQEIDNLLNSIQFKHWFITEEKGIFKEVSENFLTDIINNKQKFLSSNDALMKLLKDSFLQIAPDLFEENTKHLYSKRLLDDAYLLSVNKETQLSNSALKIRNELMPKYDITKSYFAYKLIAKSLLEFLKRYQYEVDNIDMPQISELWTEQKTNENTKKELENISDIINSYKKLL